MMPSRLRTAAFVALGVQVFALPMLLAVGFVTTSDGTAPESSTGPLLAGAAGVLALAMRLALDLQREAEATV